MLLLYTSQITTNKTFTINNYNKNIAMILLKKFSCNEYNSKLKRKKKSNVSAIFHE